MLTNLQTRLKNAGRLLPFALLPFAAHAQLGYTPANAVNAAGTYTDLAATGTSIATANTDDANSAAQPIGFSFTYNGMAFTQFVLNTNGFIKLGATAPSAPDLFLPESLTASQIDPFESTNAADVNIIAPFNFDLTAGSAAGGTEYRVATTGTAPNRVCTIQWKNVADKTLDYDQQYGSMNFQAKLYETTNNIEFVYGTTLQGTLPNDYRFAVAGIKGSSTAQSVMVLKTGTGTTPWSAATFINGFYTAAAFNYSGNVRPDLGRTYRFVPGAAPTVANDDPAGAIALTLGSTCTPVNGTNANATTTPANGYANGTNPNTACGIAVNPKDVWYKFTTAASGTGSTSASIQVTGSAAGYLRAFSTTGGAAGPFTEIGCASGGTNNTVSAPLNLTSLTPSTTYYIFVAGFGSADTQGPFTICVSSTAPIVCGDPTAATIGNATNTSLQVAFTPGANNVSYNVTYSAGGTATTVSPAPTASPVTITGLVPGTAYTITIQSVCAGGSTGAILTGSASTTGTPPAASYVTLPYTESFEGPWVNGLSTRDLPTVNWRNSPATGDRSWRREDDGVIANWRYLPLGAYTPASSTGSHSARFHTYGSGPAGVLGILDLYVNMSAAGSKTLNFDYINPTGTDSLKVFVSTDGGATFATTPARRLGISTAFAAVQPVTITSTSATTVIRFQAKSDFGDDDLGIDNLRLSVVTATTNPALAATVNLYPNPAHQSFQLTVPTGLRAASATLSNTLGQVVQSRQLNLPAAGGTADFNVSSLAPGVYTLTLKSGADLVVKRVVVE